MTSNSRAKLRLLVSSAMVGVAFVGPQAAMAACTTISTTSATIASGAAPCDAVTGIQTAIDGLATDANTTTNLTVNVGNLTGDNLQVISIAPIDNLPLVSGDGVYDELTGAIVVNNTGIRLGNSPSLNYEIGGVGAVSAANTLNFTNTGTLDYLGSNGNIHAYGFGGAVTITNNGRAGNIDVDNSLAAVTVSNTGVARNVWIDAEGAVSVTNSGQIGNIDVDDTNTGNATAPNITITNTATGTAGNIDAQTGGTINITNAGAAGSIFADSRSGWRTPTSGEATAGVVVTPGANVVVNSTGYADGDITAISEGGVTVTTVSGSGSIVQTTSFSSGTATVTAGETNGDVRAWALGGATVNVVDGPVDGDVTALTWGPGTQVLTSTTFSGGSSGSNATTYDAGVAAVTVAAGAEVWGTATANSIGGATATINGYTDGLNVFSSSLFSFIPSFDTVSAGSSVSGSTSTTSTGSLSLTNSGKTAVATIGATGYIDGDVNVYGDTGASLNSAGQIWGDVNVISSVSNGTSGGTTTFVPGVSGGSSTTTSTQTVSWTAAGGSGSFTNSGTVYGDGSTVTVIGNTGASLTNSGTIYDNVEIRALGQNTSFTRTDTNTAPASGSATDSWTSTLSATVTGADASATNSGLITGDVHLAGATGTFNNTATGAVGSVSLGEWINPLVQTVGTSPTGSNQFSGPFGPQDTLYSGSVTDTETLVQDNVAPVRTVTAAPVFAQTYTLNSSGLISGNYGTAVDVYGATPATSVTATVNLNNGSITLGGIYGQIDEDTGAFSTNTTVNLNGGGFLGSDRYLTFQGDSLSPEYVQVQGVNTLNKTGTGTFLIAGAGNYYNYDINNQLVSTDWTLNIGTFNINAGEIQLAVGEGYGPQALQAVSGSSTADFGILGNVVNNATLVIGTRVDQTQAQFLNSLTSTGQAIDGIHVVQTGNFTQTSGGTTVVGITPSLVRTGPLAVLPGGTSTEVLGPITAGVSVPYFTTAADALAHEQAAGVLSSPSRWDITGNLNLAGKLQAVVTRDGIYQNGDGGVVFSYTGTGTVTATGSQNLTSPFVSFDVVHNSTAKTVSLVAARKSYATAATNANAAAAGVALDSTIPVVVSRLTQNAATGDAFTSVGQFGLTQDLANIISGMDWRVGAAGAAAVLNDLSSGEFYGSLAAVDQNSLFGDAIKGLSGARKNDDAIGTTFWLSPAGNFAKYTRDHSGASDIKATTYGVAGGFDFAYADEAAFGIGVAYAQHDVNAQGTPEKADAHTITIGAYWTQTFGPIYANARVAYGFSNFEVTRDLVSLARSTYAKFNGSQFDASAEVGYEWQTGALGVTPFAKLALRRWSLDGVTEQGGQSVGLIVAKDSKSIFSPELGVRLSGELGIVRPYLTGSYTFQGDIGSDRTVQYIGGGNSFHLQGIDPKGYGTIAGGLTGSLSKNVSLFLDGRYSFSGGNKVARIGGGFGLKF